MPQNSNYTIYNALNYIIKCHSFINDSIYAIKCHIMYNVIWMDGFNVPYSMNEWMNYLMCQIIWMNGGYDI
jgi:hypothetical protein